MSEPDSTTFTHQPQAPSHVSVLLEPVLAALQPHPGGFLAVDCTANGGGHMRGLLQRSAPDGYVLGLDADPTALDEARGQLSSFAGRWDLVCANFRHLARVARERDLAPLDAVLFDLGLSSRQLDVAGRGFSWRFDEPLDMRFAPEKESRTAADLLNTLPPPELEEIFRAYGEEPRARRVARVVAERRRAQPFTRTVDLVAAVTRALGPSRGRIHPATRVFQALRIAVNDELGALREGLPSAIELLKPGGRVAVISFHSLEDRIVKWLFRSYATEAGAAPALKIITRKPLLPTEEERRSNPRSRSAKLRVAERLSSSLSPALRGSSV